MLAPKCEVKVKRVVVILTSSLMQGQTVISEVSARSEVRASTSASACPEITPANGNGWESCFRPVLSVCCRMKNAVEVLVMGYGGTDLA